MRCKPWSNDAAKFPPSMAMRIEFAAQIMKQFGNWRFFWLHRSSFHSPKFCAQIKWRITFCQTSRLFILLERAETEIRFSIANSMFKTKMDIDRQSPRLMPNNCKHLDPPYFSLPTTFNGQKYLILVHEVFFSMNPISLRDNKLFSMIVLF
jgi:hypothetical protein